MDSRGNGMNERIEQLTEMLSYIANIDKEKARQLVVSTRTGQDILANNITVLYEQQTANLLDIAQELRESRNKTYNVIAEMLTIDSIVNAEKNNRNQIYKKTYHMEKATNAKSICRTKNMKAQKRVLAIKKQNRLNLKKMR